ncbi:MAG: hypothetical protein WCE79_27605 [Xanthobacteraceae bacterium]
MLTDRALPSQLLISLDWSRLPSPLQKQLLDVMGGRAGGEGDTKTSTQKFESFPLTVQQVRQMMERVNPATVSLLRKMAENYDPSTNRLSISWPAAREITQTRNYDHFARGLLGGLHKSLRNVTDDGNARLLWSSDETDWSWDEQKNDYTTGTGYIDGPAANALREYFGMS